MSFQMAELGLDPGIYGNRSKRASKGRWVDGNLVRFRNSVPAQVGGWQAPPMLGGPVQGRARDMISWRPNDLTGRYCAIGTHSNAYVFDGSSLVDVTPDGFEVGRTDTLVGAGYGAGFYGAGAWGTTRTISGNVAEAAVWTFDRFGEVVLGCYSYDGKIYRYQLSTDAKFVPLPNAPTARAICVSPDRFVFAFGCNGNPNLVMWSDREDPTTWTPTTTNRAGSYDMQATSPFQCGKCVDSLVLGWTMTELFGFSPLSNSLIYSRDLLASDCGVMGPHAAVVCADTNGAVAYWMGQSSFFIYDGQVRKLPCDLQEYVFRDINLMQRIKIQARHNSIFGEVWFFYPSSLSNEVDRAVVYSYETNAWSKAIIDRLAWCDAGIFPLPIAIDSNGTIYQHETGDTANGAPMPSYILSCPLEVGVGQQFAEVADFWPDLEDTSGTCALTLVGRDYPGAPDVLFGPYEFDPTTEKIDLAATARQMQIKIAGVSGHWELGIPRYSFQAGSGR